MKVFALWCAADNGFETSTVLVNLYEKEADAEKELAIQNSKPANEQDPNVTELYFITPQPVILGSGSILSAVQDWVIEVLNEEKESVKQ